MKSTFVVKRIEELPANHALVRGERYSPKLVVEAFEGRLKNEVNGAVNVTRFEVDAAVNNAISTLSDSKIVQFQRQVTCSTLLLLTHYHRVAVKYYRQ